MPWFNLGKALDERQWSMRVFAHYLGVKPQVITRYFRQGFDPNASTLLKWTAVLDCSLDDLLDDKLDESERLMPRPVTAKRALEESKSIKEKSTPRRPGRRHSRKKTSSGRNLRR